MSKQGKADRQQRELMRLRRAVARQKAQMAQAKQVDTGQSRPVVGMAADAVLKLPGYTKKNRTSKPRLLGYDRNGLKVRWYYKDMMLTLQRTRPNGYYQVTEVKERGGKENEQSS